MGILRLLSRLAFICNICFLLASFVQWLPHPPDGVIVSNIIVLGWIVSILVNIIVNAWAFFLLIFGKLGKAQVPAWLLIVNFIFFVIQLILFLK
jgi:hypothetical protein